MKSPLAEVTAVRAPCSAGEVTVTVTPGSTRPSGSMTLPVTVPVGMVCAAATAAMRRTSARPVRMRLTCMATTSLGMRDAACGDEHSANRAARVRLVLRRAPAVRVYLPAPSARRPWAPAHENSSAPAARAAAPRPAARATRCHQRDDDDDAGTAAAARTATRTARRPPGPARPGRRECHGRAARHAVDHQPRHRARDREPGERARQRQRQRHAGREQDRVDRRAVARCGSRPNPRGRSPCSASA